MRGARAMTRALVLFAHPCAESFSAALHGRVVETLTARGWEVDDCDLNAEGFQPVLTEAERRGYHDAGNITLVQGYVDRLRAAQALVMVFPVWTAGWASANKYALLGGMRAVAQGISYEIPMVLSALVPVIFAGSMDVNEIVTWQAEHHWLVLGPGLFAFVIFFVSSLAEANRIPFDIPEAESELVAGVTTEYSGMRFGLFYMAEYLHTLVASAVASALFLGGWNGLFGLADGIHWMLAKTLALFFMITWVRWSLVRFRSDQLMRLCWTYLVPISLALVMVSALWVYYEPMLGGH